MTTEEMIRRINASRAQTPEEERDDAIAAQVVLERALREALDIATYYTGDGTDSDAMDICKAHAARIAELRGGLADGSGPGTSARLAALESELARIRPVYQAACAWRSARCTRLPGCGSYDDSHDAECAIEVATHLLSVEVDRARATPAEAKS